MSYIKTVKILDNITASYITENVDTVYQAIANKIASVTGWTKDEISPQLYVGTGDKQIRIGISWGTGGGAGWFNYDLHTTNDNGNEEIYSKFVNTYTNASGSKIYAIYLNYCKSKSGKTIGIGLSGNIDGNAPSIDFIIAEDVNGDFAGIGLNVVTTSSSDKFGAKMVYNGYKCTLSTTNYGTYNIGALRPIIDTRLSTTICKLPNYLGACMFKEAFMILSIPISLGNLNSVVLDIEGKKYQGCYAISAYSSMQDSNTLAILAE